MAHMKRSVFFVSDRTGITAETLGESLLTQFSHMEFERIHLPFITSPDKARLAVSRIRAAQAADGREALVFSTLTDPGTQAIIATSSKFVFDLFGTFIEPLEMALDSESSHTAGKMHGMGDANYYQHRVDALNFTLDHDDGVRLKDLDQANVILIGVSRSGKTPTSLYLAMHFHLKAANYPLNDDDFELSGLPVKLRRFREKIYGLSIQAEQLSQIRHGRRPNSTYASLEQCRTEAALAERLYREEGIPFVDTTTVSIEEIATTILQHFGFERPRHS